MFEIGDKIRCKYNKKIVGEVTEITPDRYVLDCDAVILKYDEKYFEKADLDVEEF
jgi:hypothetical protein